MSDNDRCEQCGASDWDCPCALADNAATGQGDDQRDGLLPYFGPEDDAA